MPANAYGELNPFYPKYEDKNVELDELIRFFKYSYQPSSGYQGTAVFEILDGDETYIMAIRAHPKEGITGFRQMPSAEHEINFHCILPYDTFHDAFWGYTSCKTLVMGGGCKIKGWAYRAAYNFGTSFDSTSESWIAYYKSGNSIKKMVSDTTEDGIREIMDGVAQKANTVTKIKRIGADLPQSAQETEFMYQWKPTLDITANADDDALKRDWFGFNVWRNRQRKIIERNYSKHVAKWDNLRSSITVRNTMNEYRDNLNFNPLIIGTNIAMKCRDKIKTGSNIMMDEYYGWYSQHTHNGISDVSLSLFSKSMSRFNAFIYKQAADNELVHFSLLNSLF